MENRITEQFKGFLNTFPLWKGPGPFDIDQINLPPHPSHYPEENELLNAIPSLSRNFVMGKRMESFFGYLIRNSSEYNLIAENLQISRNKITIGEIDFIVEDKKNVGKLHIELVYKFYVYDPSYDKEEERWIGPNRRDSLLRKIKKLKEHQFPLIYNEETIHKLSTLKIDSNGLKQKVCFKTNLFVPRGMQDKIFPLLNNSCICGYWIHLPQFKPKEFSSNLFFIPQKPDWPIDPVTNKEWHPFPMIYKKVIDLHSREISPLIWMKTPLGKVERFFVVWW